MTKSGPALCFYAAYYYISINLFLIINIIFKLNKPSRYDELMGQLKILWQGLANYGSG